METEDKDFNHRCKVTKELLGGLCEQCGDRILAVESVSFRVRPTNKNQDDDAVRDWGNGAMSMIGYLIRKGKL